MNDVSWIYGTIQHSHVFGIDMIQDRPTDPSAPQNNKARQQQDASKKEANLYSKQKDGHRALGHV